MKNGFALVLALVLGVLGFAAMYVVLNRKAEQASETKDPSVKRRIVVARKALAAGTRLAAAHLDTRPIPSEYLSSAHIEESQMTTVMGLTLRTPVKEGEPVLLPALESGRTSGAREIENNLNPADRLAIAIDLDEAQSVAGLIEPGQRVDVFATVKMEKDGKDAGFVTLLLLQNRTVLAVDVVTHSRYEGDPKSTTEHVVTLAVTAAEAQKLALVRETAKLHLALRKMVDDRTEKLPPVGTKLYPLLEGAP